MAYILRGAAIYNGSSIQLTTHIEKDGVRLTNPTSATAELRQLDGTLVSTFTGVSSPGTYGQFKFPSLSVSLATKMYMITTQATDDTATVRSTILYVIVYN